MSMTNQIEPKHGLMELDTDVSNMQSALLLAETDSASFVLAEIKVLEEAYQVQQSGDLSIPATHSQNHQFTLHVADGYKPQGSGYTVVTVTYTFADPGYPPAGQTGTLANDEQQETESTLNTFDTGMEAWQQALEQGVTQGFQVVNMISENQAGFVQFAQDANQASANITKLLRNKL